MKALVVIGHPNVGKSFNHAIASTAVKSLEELGYTVIVRDLYQENFDPVMPVGEDSIPIDELPASIQKEMEDIRGSDALIFVHPNWWGTPPAILKGWIDRVLRNGFAYGFTENGPVPYLTDKTVQVFTTSNTPRDVELEVYHDPLENFWKTVVFGLCGARSFERRNFEPIIVSDGKQRADWLREVEETVKRRFS
ncbi:MAG: NAD(P)H-dependent oxidoreductase [Thermoguttaceae bacterium]|nr:NAD(P)H-dependent oxidoreductase [Thermoguttaceae bacterium]